MREVHREAIEKLRNAQLKEDHAKKTRDSYRGWVIRYRNARLQRRCRDVQGFLDILIHGHDGERVGRDSISQAVNALVFYHRHVLNNPIPENSLKFPRRSRNRNHPDIPSHQEVVALFSHMRGLPLLQAEMQYGTASRPTALLSLRLKDVDLIRGNVTFRFDKGGKTRTVPLPQVLLPKLHAHIASIRLQWREDHDRGIICPVDPPSLMRKIGERKLATLPWYWLFPSAAVKGNHRWHATSRALSSALDRAAIESGITRRITPHSLRHAGATALVDRGENPRRIQEHLGHSRLETTEIYLHSTAKHGLKSPLDMPPSEAGVVPFQTDQSQAI